MDTLHRKDEIGSFGESAKEYVTLKVNGYKYRAAENFAIISNKTLVVLVAIMLGVVILQFVGFAIAFMIGGMVGNIALGFVSTAIIFALVLAAVYARRETLFLARMRGMYSRMFFGKEIGDLKGAEAENALREQMKQVELQAHVNSLKELLNPFTYINYAVVKLQELEKLATAFLEGYTAIKKMVENYRNQQ